MKAIRYFIIAVLVLSTLLILKPVHADNADSVMIVDPQVVPSTIKVGDTFAINATLVNNSTNTINVKNGCAGSFSVAFDDHAKSEVAKVCNWMAIQIILKPGEKITTSSLASNLSYKAIAPGTANATVTFSYIVGNSTTPNVSFDNNSTEISKSFMFTVSNQTKTIPSIASPLEQVRSGIAAKDVTCKQGLELVFKSTDGSPACAKPDTASVLIQRGWAKNMSQPSQ